MTLPARALRSAHVLVGILLACTSLGARTARAQVAPAAHGTKSAADADIAFVQGMIAHHAQAVEMSALIAERTTRPELRALGERISVSQKDQIAMMQQWLHEHGAAIPDPAGGHAQHSGHGVLMPGMLSAEEMQALAASSGPAFDRLFLAGMIKHPQGALTMVGELLRVPGAARQPQLYEFAADIDADQRAEIARMRALLARLPAP